MSQTDAVPSQSSDLQADESLLTGESVPVRKLARATAAPDAAVRPGGDDLPYVFSGALIVRGTGIAEVTGTGSRSEIGKIGQSLSTLETEPPRLQAQTQRLVRARQKERSGSRGEARLPLPRAGGGGHFRRVGRAQTSLDQHRSAIHHRLVTRLASSPHGTDRSEAERDDRRCTADGIGR